MESTTLVGKLLRMLLLRLIANLTIERDIGEELNRSSSAFWEESFNSVADTYIASFEKNNVAAIIIPAKRSNQVVAGVAFDKPPISIDSFPLFNANLWNITPKIKPPSPQGQRSHSDIYKNVYPYCNAAVQAS